MKKSVRLMLAGVLAASALFSLSAAEKEIKRDLKPTAAWNLYIPGKGNKKDVLKDLNKAGWQVSNKTVRRDNVFISPRGFVLWEIFIF